MNHLALGGYLLGVCLGCILLKTDPTAAISGAVHVTIYHFIQAYLQNKEL